MLALSEFQAVPYASILLRILDREQVRVESYVSVMQAWERIGDSDQIVAVECPQPKRSRGTGSNGSRHRCHVGGLQLPDLLLKLKRFAKVSHRIQFPDCDFRVSDQDTHSG